MFISNPICVPNIWFLLPGFTCTYVHTGVADVDTAGSDINYTVCNLSPSIWSKSNYVSDNPMPIMVFQHGWKYTSPMVGWNRIVKVDKKWATFEHRPRLCWVEILFLIPASFTFSKLHRCDSWLIRCDSHNKFLGDPGNFHYNFGDPQRISMFMDTWKNQWSLSWCQHTCATQKTSA